MAYVQTALATAHTTPSGSTRFEKHKVGYAGTTAYSSSSRRAHLTSRQVGRREGLWPPNLDDPLPVDGRLGVCNDGTRAQVETRWSTTGTTWTVSFVAESVDDHP